MIRLLCFITLLLTTNIVWCQSKQLEVRLAIDDHEVSGDSIDILFVFPNQDTVTCETVGKDRLISLPQLFHDEERIDIILRYNNKYYYCDSRDAEWYSGCFGQTEVALLVYLQHRPFYTECFFEDDSIQLCYCPWGRFQYSLLTKGLIHVLYGHGDVPGALYQIKSFSLYHLKSRIRAKRYKTIDINKNSTMQK